MLCPHSLPFVLPLYSLFLIPSRLSYFLNYFINCVLLDGRGELYTQEGSRYEGDFVDGKRHGHGEMLWYNGDRYIGEWKDDNIHGTPLIALISRVKYSVRVGIRVSAAIKRI